MYNLLSMDNFAFFTGFRDHGQSREDREAGSCDAHNEDLQAGQTLCRSPVSHLHAQPGEDVALNSPTCILV